MNSNLAKAARQLLEVWKQLGLNQRISLVLATFTIVVGFAGVAFWSSRVNYSLLYGRLEEGEAAKVVAVLEENSVPYKIGTSGSVLVPSDQVAKMRMRMAAKGIPKGEGTGFELLDRPNFGVSDFVQRANYVRAVQGELGRTIAQLDEVEAARVMIVMPENRLLADAQKKTDCFGVC